MPGFYILFDVIPQKPTLPMQDRAVPHVQSLSWLSQTQVHLGLSPCLFVFLVLVFYDAFLSDSVGTFSLLPQKLMAGGGADQESKAGSKLEGCVERELEWSPSQLTVPSSLWPQGGTPGLLGCQRAWERGVAGPVSQPS